MFCRNQVRYSESHWVISRVRLEVTPVLAAFWLLVVEPFPAADVTPDEAGPIPTTRTVVNTVLLHLARIALGSPQGSRALLESSRGGEPRPQGPRPPRRPPGRS